MLYKLSGLYDSLHEKLNTNADAMFQEVRSEQKKASLVYLRSMCDEKKIQQFVLKPFYEIATQVEYQRYIASLPQTQPFQDITQTLQSILQGNLALFFGNHLYLINLNNRMDSTINEATVETVIQGPQFAFSENGFNNINLLRQRYQLASLHFEMMELNTYTKNKVYIAYDTERVNQHALRELKQQLSLIQADSIQAVGQLEKLLSKQKRSLFPTMMITERPDRAIVNLTQGKIIVILDGTPFVLMAPAIFHDFMTSMDDTYQTWGISTFLILLRYLGLFISLTFPSLYVGVTSYNPEIFRVQLALSIAGSRVSVPYPSYLEVFFMLIMMELLTEASIRLPKAIGSTATTVGGLILGQAATEAGLVSNIMIIIVSAVAISNFVIPINAMGFAMRVAKYLILFITVFWGLIGLAVAMMFLIGYLCHYENYGEPYLRLYLFKKGDLKLLSKHKGEQNS